MRTTVLLAILLAAGWWYFDGSRRMTEANVREAFASELDAVRRFDGDWLCSRIADDFAAVDVSNSPEGPVRHELDHDGACEQMHTTMRTMQRLSAAYAGMLAPDIEVQIEKIELAADHKSALVGSRMTLRIADMTLMRAHLEERMIRRNGRVLSLGGQSRTWVYQGE